jgi:hypothetical protein
VFFSSSFFVHKLQTLRRLFQNQRQLLLLKANLQKKRKEKGPSSKEPDPEEESDSDDVASLQEQITQLQLENERLKRVDRERGLIEMAIYAAGTNYFFPSFFALFSLLMRFFLFRLRTPL